MRKELREKANDSWYCPAIKIRSKHKHTASRCRLISQIPRYDGRIVIEEVQFDYNLRLEEDTHGDYFELEPFQD